MPTVPHRNRASSFLVVSALLIVAASCGALDSVMPTTAIADINARTGEFLGKEVVIRGVVSDSTKLPLISVRFYTVTQDGASILVLTESDPPLANQRVTVRGTVENAAVFAGRSFGLHLRERKRS